MRKGLPDAILMWQMEKKNQDEQAKQNFNLTA
jgi:hypothetical protein